MFGMSRKERELLQEEMMWRNARREGWVSVQDCLPTHEDDVEVIGRDYPWHELGIASGKFNPSRGWNSSFRTIYAWRRAPEILGVLKAKYPAVDR